ncbi:lantibiotic dehydratase [Actinacidiphila acididurans]|uniref:Lantibiotic dehydratase n=1 Tax=Actinacidiphila acididurans TaxID=2784346 RepID=A0ABS2TYS9_9ACTN|nr:lantibiotic dehydratase [Actinacidiphila acididurans]MBM9508483.1 lantibiotic dehydratase [Actinacidiphila acididurans]
MTSVNDSQTSTIPVPGGAWSLVPIVVLRQAGFPMEALDPLVDSASVGEAHALLEHRKRLASLARELKPVLRRHPVPGGPQSASRVGRLRPLPGRELRRATAALPDEAARTLRAYQECAQEFAGEQEAFATRHRARLDRARTAVVEAFGDERLRQVLLLSNDSAYPEFAAWLDAFQGDMGRHTRRMTDLLTMYLQRVTTKNETHSHFGPFTVGRVGDVPGIAWTSEREMERRTLFSHWAAEKLAQSAAAAPGLFDFVRPRRRPLSFLREGRIDLYAFTTRDGLDTDWNFQHLGGREVAAHEEWMWRRCDGERTIHELRSHWDTEFGPDAPVSFEQVLKELVEREWVVAEFEIPVGDHEPLAALRRQLLPAPPEQAAPILSATDRFEQDLTRFATLPLAERPAALAAIKARFERLTGTPANRNSGLHYADRSILFEEAHGEPADLTIGPDIARFITDELSIVYETVLARPRLRMRRELVILTRWVAERFGADVEVPLDRLYSEFFRDRHALAQECAAVETELAALDRVITDALLGEEGVDRPEVVVERDRMEAILAAHPRTPAAVVDPDVLFAAASRQDLREGRFTAVIGDCHAVREVITHTSFGPLIQERAPELLPEVYAGYLSLLDDGEVLANLSRGHPDKSSTQLVYPCYDLEVFGRSGQSRDRVVQPSQLYVVLRDGRLELRARGVEGRLRLMAPPAGGPSIRQDPLSPFAFPRHFGGAGLDAPALDHIPRIRSGRVVLQRETWRVPAARLRGAAAFDGPVERTGEQAGGEESAEFVAACRLRAELGLPRHVFVKIPGEPKPVYVDWQAPLLVRQLCRLAARKGGTLEVSEMLPTPDQRWLSVDGRRYTSELRCAVFSPGSPA